MEHGPITQILTHKETIRWKRCGLHRPTTPTVEIPKTTAAFVRGLRAKAPHCASTMKQTRCQKVTVGATHLHDNIAVTK